MFKIIIRSLVVLGLLVSFVPTSFAGAMDDLQKTAGGGQDTGTTFDGSNQNQGKGTINTRVNTPPTQVPPVSGQPVSTSTGTAGGTNPNPAPSK